LPLSESPGDFYRSRISVLDNSIRKIRKTISWFYAGRLFSFLAMAGFMVLFVQFQFNAIWLFPAGGLLLVFLFLVRADLKADYRLRLLNNKLLQDQQELDFLGHKFSDRPDGVVFREFNPHLSDDFDVFGPGSLFQYLNRCVTQPGTRLFARNLCFQEKDVARIKARQEAIRELAQKLNFIQDFRAKGLFLKETGNEAENLQQWLNESETKTGLLQVLCLVVPVFNLGILVLLFTGFLPWNLLTLPILAGLFAVYSHHKRLKKAHYQLGNTAKTFEQYTSLIQLIEEEEFTSGYLNSCRQALKEGELTAGKSMQKLFNLLNRFDLRYNILVSFFLNAFLVFDLQVYIRLVRWKEIHRNSVGRWFASLAEVDSLSGFAVFRFNNADSVCYPHISEKDFELDAVDMGHPLIQPAVRVCNSISFTGTPAVRIITGANMAGKSTFLRTLSVNLILAMNGAPVLARSFRFTPCDLLSSIKIQDSLANNESYFYAELLRLKEIINHVSQHKTLVILDEILRGTNTKDKQTGTLGLLEKLINLNSVVLIATHDLVIGDLEQKYPSFVRNNCFEVELTDDQLIFDYKLKPGISQKLNASFLMQKMGIVG